MTSLLTLPESPQQPDSMPGWDIVADMTPPELVNLRWIAVLQRRIAAGLVLVVLLCGAGYLYASHQDHVARSEADAAADRTRGLAESAGRFAAVTSIETTVRGIDDQMATLMENDVDVARLVTAIRRALPRSMAVQNVTVVVTGEGPPVGTTDGLDRSGHPAIGTVSISGSGRTLDDLPVFVDGLDAVPGLVEVLPTSNQVTEGKAQFSVSVTFTDQLLSHRYDETEPEAADAATSR
jgi:hypothetical protein